MADTLWRAVVVMLIVAMLAVMIAAAWVSLLIDEGDERGPQ